MVTSVPSAEAVGAVLHDLRSGGLIEERVSPRLMRFRCYLPPSRLLPVTLRALRARIRALRRYGVDPAPARITRRAVAARRWAAAWRAHAAPVRVGRLYVRPTWVRSPQPMGLTAIAIDPGMAFGTGTHASTRLCLRALQAHVLPNLGADRRAVPRGGNRGWTRGSRRSKRGRGGPERGRHRPTVFDIGTGSGILAIAAARLGAARVWAVDTDPLAVAVARGNVRQNGARSQVRVVRGSGLDRAPGKADVILANLTAETIVPLLALVGTHLRPGGVFVGSGITAGGLPGVERAARAARLRRVRVLAQGEWRAVIYATSASVLPRRRPSRRTRQWRVRS